MNLNRFLRTTLACGPLFIAACGDDTTEADTGDTTGGTTMSTDSNVTLTTMPSTTLTTDPTTGPTTDPDTTVGEDTTGDTTDGDATESDTTEGTTEDTTSGTTGDTTEGTTEGETEGTTGGSLCTVIEVTGVLPASVGASSASYETLGVDPNVGGADPDLFRLEFYDDASGTFDLGSGANDNYATCDQCVRLFEDLDGQGIARQYFQQSGSIEIDASSSVLDGTVVATLTDVVLIEVTVDPDNAFESTPVPDGECVQLISPQQVDAAPNNSCAGVCGESTAAPGSLPACYCDELCFTNGDCCDDICDEGICSDDPVCDTELACEPLNVDSDLDGTEPTYHRATGSDPNNCGPSAVGTAVYYDVYVYELTGPGPHDLVATTCGTATFDTVLSVYQSAGGGAGPFDPTEVCTDVVAINDDFVGCDGNTSHIEVSGLEPGIVEVVVTSFGNDTTGDYTLAISSDTCE